MADVISRLKLDSGEFDSKIKRAGQELLAYSEHCKKMGLEMGYANKDAKEFARALGDMNTVSQTARGKLNELTEAFVNLKTMYNGMTDAEKQNTFGKELAASLDKLKNRIDEAKQNINSVNAELGNTKQAEDGAKSGLEGLTSALGINVKSLAGWGAALTAGKVALDVAKDAFFASEANVDEWGRTVQSAQSVYEGFLISINNGDISGFLSRMDDIVKAARAAYNELDTLGTMKTIQAPKVSAQQTENERIRSMIQTGRYIAPVDGRRNAVFNGREMQNGDKLTSGQIRALEKQLQNGMQNVVKLVGNEVKQSGKAINAYYDSIAKQNGMSLQEFKKGTSTWEEFEKKIKGYEEYRKWDTQARTEFAKQGGRGNVDFDKNNPFAEFKKWGTFRVDKMGENSYNDLVRLIQQRDQQAAQAYGMQSQAYRAMNRAEGFTVSKLMGNGGKGGKTDKNLDDEQQVQQKINELLKEALTADAKRQGEIRQQVAELQKQQEKYKDIKNIAQGILPKDKVAVFTIDGQLSEETKKNLREIENVTIDDKTMTVTADTQEAMQKVQELIGQVSTTTLQMKVAPPDLDKLFPDMSKQNYNTGYAGSAQAKADSAIADFAQGGVGNADISGFISSAKQAIDQSELGDDLYNKMTEKLKDATIFQSVLTQAIAGGANAADLSGVAQEIKQKLLEGDIDESAWQEFLDKINELIQNADLKLTFDVDTKSVTTAVKQQKKETAEMAKEWQAAGSAIQAVGSAMSQIEDPAAKVLGTIAQAVATMALSYSQAALATAPTGWGWIAFAATGLATMISSITAIKQATSGFANGGVIPGNSMSGDNLRGMTPDGTIYGLNSQEIILNRAQQGNLASQFEGGGIGTLHLDTVIRGEDIRLVLNNNGRRTGRGEYVQSRNSRG